MRKNLRHLLWRHHIGAQHHHPNHYPRDCYCSHYHCCCCQSRSGCQNFRASFHQASNQNSTGFGLKNFFRAPPARSAGKPVEHSYRYRLRFGGPIWLPKLPSIFPRVFENFQATDRSISHARRYRFPKIATGNRTILVSLSMFYAGHRWYMCDHTNVGARHGCGLAKAHLFFVAFGGCLNGFVDHNALHKRSWAPTTSNPTPSPALIPVGTCFPGTNSPPSPCSGSGCCRLWGCVVGFCLW